jgi:hypothetical protein
MFMPTMATEASHFDSRVHVCGCAITIVVVTIIIMILFVIDIMQHEYL